MLPRTIWATTRQQNDSGALPGLEKGHDAVDGRDQAAGCISSPENWMSHLKDNLLVSSLSIPGTHDSAAYTRPWPFLATQQMTILQQLNEGIRYFDLRCGLQGDVVVMVHGPALLGLTLLDVLEIMYAWLDAHSHEALLVQIKEDRAPERSTVSFAQLIRTSTAQRPERWRTANTTPSLGELRGKLQLFRRFGGLGLDAAYGIDVTAWPDNPRLPFTITTSSCVQLTVQDHYGFPDPTPLPSLIATKRADASGLLDCASLDQDLRHWYLNFTSAYEFNWSHQLSPREIAVGGYFGFRWEAGMNPFLRTYLLAGKGKQRYGIVAMDFPDVGAPDLIDALIQSNFKAQSCGAGSILLLGMAVLLLVGWTLACPPGYIIRILISLPT